MQASSDNLYAQAANRKAESLAKIDEKWAQELEQIGTVCFHACLGLSTSFGASRFYLYKCLHAVYDFAFQFFHTAVVMG